MAGPDLWYLQSIRQYFVDCMPVAEELNIEGAGPGRKVLGRVAASHESPRLLTFRPCRFTNDAPLPVQCLSILLSYTLQLIISFYDSIIWSSASWQATI
jgi:hypothetical protein